MMGGGESSAICYENVMSTLAHVNQFGNQSNMPSLCMGNKLCACQFCSGVNQAWEVLFVTQGHHHCMLQCIEGLSKIERLEVAEKG